MNKTLTIVLCNCKESMFLFAIGVGWKNVYFQDQ